MSATDRIIAASIRRPIEGPSAWVGADMRGREAEWSYRLSPAEIAEIEAALKSVLARGLDVAAIRREDFRCRRRSGARPAAPGARRARLRAVARRAGEDRPIASAAVYWGIGGAFGGARSERACTCSAMSMTWAAAARPIHDPQLCHISQNLSIAAMSWRCCACGAPSRVGGGGRQFDDRAQRHGGTPTRSAGAAVSAVPVDRRGEVRARHSTRRRCSTSTGKSRCCSGCISARRSGSPGAAAYARTSGARHAGRTGGRSRIAARHELHAGRHSVLHNHTILHAHGIRGLARGGANAICCACGLPGARPLPPVFAECYGDITIGDRGIICKGPGCTPLRARLTSLPSPGETVTIAVHSPSGEGKRMTAQFSWSMTSPTSNC